MTAPRTQTTRANGLFITNATAPLLGAVLAGGEDPVDEGLDGGPDEVGLVIVLLLPPRVVVPLGYPPVLVVVPFEGAVLEVTIVLLL